jgi:hypothetical protein
MGRGLEPVGQAGQAFSLGLSCKARQANIIGSRARAVV